MKGSSASGFTDGKQRNILLARSRGLINAISCCTKQATRNVCVRNLTLRLHGSAQIFARTTFVPLNKRSLVWAMGQLSLVHIRSLILCETKLCLLRNGVYQFTCKNCNQHYIGRTTRFIHDRVKEHLKSDISSVNKHISRCQNKDYKGIEVKIIVLENDPVNLRLFEAFYRRKSKPTLDSPEECIEFAHLLFWYLSLYLSSQSYTCSKEGTVVLHWWGSETWKFGYIALTKS